MLIRSLLIWLSIIARETLHGSARVALLQPVVGDFRARQLAVFTGSPLIVTVAWFGVRWIRPLSAASGPPAEAPAQASRFILQEKLQKRSFSCDMKSVSDVERVREVAAAQRGVFTKADLQVVLAEQHPAAFQRRAAALEKVGALRRFSRGMYVSDGFDLPTLSQRLAPDSYVSFGNALARKLVIGTRPERQLVAAKPGRAHSYSGLGYEIVHVHIAPHLDFGYEVADGVRWADAEKATLDALYFHLRGRRYPFDVFSDIDPARLDRKRLETYLERYRNPRFVAFARGVLRLA